MRDIREIAFQQHKEAVEASLNIPSIVTELEKQISLLWEIYQAVPKGVKNCEAGQVVSRLKTIMRLYGFE